MPAHTIPGMPAESRQAAERYAEFIDSIRGAFSNIVCCLHRTDFDAGLWKSVFNSIGIECVLGTDPYDRNSLARVAFLFSRFEYVTGNGWGSHLAYGAYFGARVSIAGPEKAWPSSAYRDLVLYTNKPRLLELACSGALTTALQHAYPFLWCDPRSATHQTEWAQFQLGQSHKLLPEALRTLFRWPRPLAHVITRHAFRGARFVRRVFTRTKANVLSLRGSNRVVTDAERDSLRRARVAVGSDSRFLYALEHPDTDFRIGVRLRRGTSDAAVYHQVICRSEYRPLIEYVRLNRIVPKVVLDYGANVGLTSLYFRNHFQDAIIYAVEASRDNCELLRFNIAEQVGIQALHAAVWPVSQQSLIIKRGLRDGREWSLQTQPGDPVEGQEAVESLSINDLLARCNIDYVDVLKMDIKGAEFMVFRDGCLDFLNRVRCISIEIHDGEGDGDLIRDALRASGFTLINCGALTIGLRIP